MKFKIRQAEPPDSAEPETEAWLDIGTDGALRLRVTNKDRDARTIFSLETDGTLYRYTGLESLDLQTGSDGRIIDRGSDDDPPRD